MIDQWWWGMREFACTKKEPAAKAGSLCLKKVRYLLGLPDGAEREGAGPLMLRPIPEELGAVIVRPELGAVIVLP